MGALRVVSFNIYFVLLTLILGAAGLFVRAARPGLAFPLARLWTCLTIAGLDRIAGVRFVVVGRDRLPPGPVIIASQHRSALDALVWFTLLDRPAYVMKQELRRVPLVGPLLQPAGMIAIDRAGGSHALRRLIRDAEAALRGGRQLVIFPEGTRVAPGSHAPPWPGFAALAGRGAPILPVATNSGQAWGRSVFGPLRRRGRLISIVVEEPLPDGAKRENLIACLEAAWTRASVCFAPHDCG